MFFLFLLALASQRVEYVIVDAIVLVLPDNSWTRWLMHIR